MVIIVLIAELIPYIASPLILEKSFSRKKVKNELLQQHLQYEEKNEENGFDDNQEKEYLGEHILHPYLGFVGVPRKNANRFCFPGEDPITQKSDDTLTICLMGGSVAMGLHQESGDKLLKELKKAKIFKGKELKIVVFALGGFKQPQQLMALNYFLSLGAYYDVVINLDGFNEIVLPYSDNLPFNVYPSYPRHWNIYSRKKLNSKVQLLLSKQLTLKEEKSSLSKSFVDKKLHNSNFGLFLWAILNNKKTISLFQIEDNLRLAINESESDYQSTGPTENISDTTQFFIEQAKLWQRSSVLIGSIGESVGFEYFHFLQPNQYNKGSKELTEEELQIAYEHNPFSYKDAVQRGYPVLKNHGKQLREQEINYFDLTLIFKKEKRTVYKDKCCHFNKLGYDLIAEKISDKIIHHFENEKFSSVEN